MITVITPGGVYRDVLYPEDRVVGQEVEPFLRDEVSAGAGFDLVLTMDFNGVVKKYTFSFKIKAGVYVEKSPWLAGGLSLLFPSAGHAYTGDWGRGLYFALPRLLLAAFGGVCQSETQVFSPSREAYLVFSFAEALDAVQQAIKVNKNLLVQE